MSEIRDLKVWKILLFLETAKEGLTTGHILIPGVKPNFTALMSLKLRVQIRVSTLSLFTILSVFIP